MAEMEDSKSKPSLGNVVTYWGFTLKFKNNRRAAYVAQGEGPAQLKKK